MSILQQTKRWFAMGVVYCLLIQISFAQGIRKEYREMTEAERGCINKCLLGHWWTQWGGWCTC